MRYFQSTCLFTAMLSTVCLFITGCLPASAPPQVSGPIDTKTASQLQASIRASNSEKYSIDHMLDGKPFKANWEIGNALKKSAQLQVKPPGDWDQADVYQALDIVLKSHEAKPWYAAIDETILELFRSALRSDDHTAYGVAPETPYEVNMTVKNNGSEWFVEAKVQILDENGQALGF